MTNFNVKISQQSEVTSSKSFSISGDAAVLLCRELFTII